jgi:phosphopantothenoylcysteine synthetase/decarboxylase
MNTHMWMHPLTERHLAVLQSMGVTVVPPVSKTLACGDIGIGGLAAVADVCVAVQASISSAISSSADSSGSVAVATV